MRGGIDAQKDEERLYRALDNARRLYGYTQADCARVLGIGQGAYSKKFRTRGFKSLELCMLAEEFGCKTVIIDALR